VVHAFPAIFSDAGLPPQVLVSDTFIGRQPSARVHRCIVSLSGTRFLIYGYTNPDPSAPTNELLFALKPGTIWRGEVAVFVLGKRVPLLSRPQSVRRWKHNLAVRLYV
jgi:hypothetical protein